MTISYRAFPRSLTGFSPAFRTTRPRGEFRTVPSARCGDASHPGVLPTRRVTGLLTWCCRAGPESKRSNATDPSAGSTSYVRSETARALQARRVSRDVKKAADRKECRRKVA